MVTMCYYISKVAATFSDFHSVHWYNWCYKSHSRSRLTSINAIDVTWLILIDDDWCWLICWMLIDMLIDADCYWLMLTDAEWSCLIYANWCWLMLIDADWSWLKLSCADWCSLILIDARIRFNKVFFCRSVPLELLRSFFRWHWWYIPTLLINMA